MADRSPGKPCKDLRQGSFTARSGKPLNPDVIQKNIGQWLGHGLVIEVLDSTDSTNDFISRLPRDRRHGRVVLAERQTAGKGRRTRTWQSPAGNLYLSAGWRFDSARGLESLSLVTAVCVCQALERQGLEGHAIKWPNDIVIEGAKLGGILVETSGNGQGVDAVIGIGINISLGEQDAKPIAQPWTDLASQPSIGTLDRNVIASAMLLELFSVLTAGPERFGPFLQHHWPQWDGLSGCDVRVISGEDRYEGRACGVTGEGALRVVVHDEGPFEGGRRLMEFRSGEVSIRRA